MSVFIPRKWHSRSQKGTARSGSRTVSWTCAMPLISIAMTKSRGRRLARACLRHPAPARASAAPRSAPDPAVAKLPAGEGAARLRGRPAMQVDLFWSFRSPYSYLSTPRLVEMERHYDLKIHVRPVYPLAVRFGEFFDRAH